MKMPVLPPDSEASAKNASVSAPSRSKLSLGLRFAITMLVSTVACGAVVFLPAGTLRFWQAWAYLGVFILPIFITYLYFLKRCPETLEGRLKTDEQVAEQRLLIRCSQAISFAVLVLPGFDHRFGWSRRFFGAQPLWLTLLSLLLALVGISAALWVMQVNRFAGATVGVESGQTVISNGPYRIVRHPMYAAATVLWLFTPLSMNSIVSLPAFTLIIPFLVLRILGEEKVLREQLPGYKEYCQRTRYRLIPLVW